MLTDCVRYDACLSFIFEGVKGKVVSNSACSCTGFSDVQAGGSALIE